MKKEFLLFGTTVMMLMSGQVFAGSCGSNCEYTIERGLLTIKGTGENGAGKIEDVSEFKSNKTVTKVVIEDGITNIVSLGLSNLESLHIPDTVKSIGGYLFAGYNKLKNITIPASTSLGQCALGCDGSRTNLDSITFNADSAKNFSKLSLGWGALGGIRVNTTIICNECTTEQISVLKNKLMTDAYAKSTVTEGNMRIYQKDGEYTLVKDFHGNLLEKRDADWNQYLFDEEGRLTKKSDKNGNVLLSYNYGNDGSTSIYNGKGELIALKGKRIFTVDEATTLVSQYKGKNTFSIRYR